MGFGYRRRFVDVKTGEVLSEWEYGRLKPPLTSEFDTMREYRRAVRKYIAHRPIRGKAGGYIGDYFEPDQIWNTRFGVVREWKVTRRW